MRNHRNSRVAKPRKWGNQTLRRVRYLTPPLYFPFLCVLCASCIISQKRNTIEKLSLHFHPCYVLIRLSPLSYSTLYGEASNAFSHCFIAALPGESKTARGADRRIWRSSGMIFTDGSRNKLVNSFFTCGIICSPTFITGLYPASYTSCVRANLFARASLHIVAFARTQFRRLNTWLCNLPSDLLVSFARYANNVWVRREMRYLAWSPQAAYEL